MNTTMKALRLSAPQEVTLAEVPVPAPKDGETLIRIRSVSICGSDVSAYRGHGQAVTYPLILGHEIAGEVQEIHGASAFSVGARVLLDPYIACGRCFPCSLGHTNCCEQLRVLGCAATDGGMSEYFALPNHMLHRIPDSIPWETAPLSEPLAIALHGLHRAGIPDGAFPITHVAIIGAGPIGLFAALAALHMGVQPILLDVIASRLAFARSLGIRYTVNPAEEDAPAVIRDITNGRMAEAVLEMSGANAGIHSALDYASYLGTIALTGWPSKETPIFTPTITRNELRIVGARTATTELEEALRLMADGSVDVRPILSETVVFADLPDALRRQAEHPEKYLKIAALL